MSNILRKQNQMINMTPPSDAYDVTYGNSTVGDALDGLQVESGSFDFIASLFDTYKTVNYKKQGNIVMLSLNLKVSSAIAADGIMGNVPSALRPTTRLWWTGNAGSFYLEPNGDFKTLTSKTSPKKYFTAKKAAIIIANLPR